MRRRKSGLDLDQCFGAKLDAGDSPVSGFALRFPGEPHSGVEAAGRFCQGVPGAWHQERAFGADGRHLVECLLCRHVVARPWEVLRFATLGVFPSITCHVIIINSGAF